MALLGFDRLFTTTCHSPPPSLPSSSSFRPRFRPGCCRSDGAGGGSDGVCGGNDGAAVKERVYKNGLDLGVPVHSNSTSSSRNSRRPRPMRRVRLLTLLVLLVSKWLSAAARLVG